MSPNGRNKKAAISRAMLLAAGLGTRLRPLTYKTPKPLLTVGGRPIIDYNLMLLKDAGVSEIIINLHHLGKMIEDHIGNGQRFGLKIEYSEEPMILGTGGGVKKAELFFGSDPFFVLNADTLIDIDLNGLGDAHLAEKPIATMVVRKLLTHEDYTPVDVKDERVVSIGKNGDYMFTGLQVLTPEFLSLLPPPRFSCVIKDGYIPAINLKKEVLAFEHKGYWADLGTRERYKSIRREFPRDKLKFKYLNR